MSDYVRKKVIRYPISEDDLSYLGVESIYDIAELPAYKGLFVTYGQSTKAFDVENTYLSNADKFIPFLDFVLEYEYGVDSGDFGKTRALRDEEREKYGKLFRQILPKIDDSKLRLVKYCWYNCSEAPYYYDDIEDDFYNEV